VFYPQARFEETVGLVFAEANAVGTPVLAHPHAAAREGLGEAPADGRQLVDARDPEAAARRLTAWWRDGRPDVSGATRFQTSRVAADWERLLGAASFPRVLRVPSEPVAVAA
jgi:glycosyltransferase involved in cell wall biosynthesis